MDVHAPAETKEVCVTSKQDRRKCRPVQVNDQAWQRRVEHSGEIVGARKAHENGCQDSRAMAEKDRWS